MRLSVSIFCNRLRLAIACNKRIASMNTLVNGPSAVTNSLSIAYNEEWKHLKDIFNVITDKLSISAQQNCNVINFHDPKDLGKRLNLKIEDDPKHSADLVKLCENIIDHSVKTGSKWFQNQLYGAVDPYGLAAAYIIESLNTNVYTYDVGPALTLIEREVLKLCGEFIGYPESEGTFTPGGSLANMYSLSLARYRYDPDIKKKGMHGMPKLLIFASEQSHYSVLKGAAFCGFGTDSVVDVQCDNLGSMLPEELEKQILAAKSQEETVPLVVWSTAGTTVLGSIDPLDKISDICKKHSLWHHVDACVGGTALLSKKSRHLLKGIEKSDSVSWDWHKLQGAPLQTAVFITRHKDLLKATHGASADYLFQPDKHYDVSYDSGDASIQCSRKPDALKVWLICNSRGLSGLEQLTDITFDRARYAYNKLAKTPGIIMVLPQPQMTSSCFWIIPKRLRGMTQDEQFWDEVGKAAPKIKRRMVEGGTAMFSFQCLTDKGLKNFFRLTIKFHPVLSYTELDEIIEKLPGFADDV